MKQELCKRLEELRELTWLWTDLSVGRRADFHVMLNTSQTPLSSLKQDLFSDTSHRGHMTMEASCNPPRVPQHPSLQMLGNNMADDFNNRGTMLLLCC